VGGIQRPPPRHALGSGSSSRMTSTQFARRVRFAPMARRRSFNSQLYRAARITQQHQRHRQWQPAAPRKRPGDRFCPEPAPQRVSASATRESPARRPADERFATRATVRLRTRFDVRRCQSTPMPAALLRAASMHVPPLGPVVKMRRLVMPITATISTAPRRS
jgi:hypothetical protein